MKTCALHLLIIVLLMSVVVSIVVGPPLRAQNAEPIVVGQIVTLHSQIMNEERQLWIFNPDYASSVQIPATYRLSVDSGK